MSCPCEKQEARALVAGCASRGSEEVVFRCGRRRLMAGVTADTSHVRTSTPLIARQ